MSLVIVGKLTPSKNPVDQLEAGRGSIPHRDGCGAVELDHRRGLDGVLESL